MQGEIAQLISLVSYGNSFIQSGSSPVTFFPDHFVFRFCNRVNFKINVPAIEVASDPIQWYSWLKHEGCNALRLYYEPGPPNPLGPLYNFVGFVGGGGTWLIEGIHSDYSSFWLKKWEVTAAKDPERKIWSVEYLRIIEKDVTENQQPDISIVAFELKQIWNDLISFCQRNKQEIWEPIFRRALDMLTNSTPEINNDQAGLLCDKAYSLLARQVLYSINVGWVFGGMGWWNDNGFEDPLVQEEFEKLNNRLYAAQIKGIVASGNEV